MHQCGRSRCFATSLIFGFLRLRTVRWFAGVATDADEQADVSTRVLQLRAQPSTLKTTVSDTCDCRALAKSRRDDLMPKDSWGADRWSTLAVLAISRSSWCFGGFSYVPRDDPPQVVRATGSALPTPERAGTRETVRSHRLVRRFEPGILSLGDDCGICRAPNRSRVRDPVRLGHFAGPLRRFDSGRLCERRAQGASSSTSPTSREKGAGEEAWGGGRRYFPTGRSNTRRVDVLSPSGTTARADSLPPPIAFEVRNIHPAPRYSTAAVREHSAQGIGFWHRCSASTGPPSPFPSIGRHRPDSS
jgi:hypothetical protein